MGKSEEVASVVSNDVRNFLKRFKCLAPKELPASLPPLWEIQHQIDFILGDIPFS